MVTVKVKTSNENPFYGCRRCLELFQKAGQTVTPYMLDAAYEEVKDSKIKREMFFSLLFSIGDITARQHNIFKGIKKDSGGNAERDNFATILSWMRDKCPKQFYKFLHTQLFNEFTCFDFLFRNRVVTKGAKVLKVYDFLADAGYQKELLNYVYAVINGKNRFNKMLVAKFLTLPRLSPRQGHKKMLAETRKSMETKITFLVELSKLMGWEYDVHDNICNFKGYRAWRKEYNKDLESVVFSTGAIKDFDRDTFISWFDKLPAQARFRVKNRILYSKIADTENLKYPKLAEWYTEWEHYKEQKQQEQRDLEEKVRQNQATEEDKIKLEKVKKQAKVNVGATNFNEIYEQICRGEIDILKLESFINKVNLPYNSLVIIDDSGSMSGAPFNFACFLAAVCLVKNPDDDGRNLIGMFNNHSHWYSYIDKEAESTPNSLMRRNMSRTVAKPFVDPTKSFTENYNTISRFLQATFQGGGTNISAIPEGLKRACDANPQILDALKSYPVWTIISDGEWNNLRSPEASINDFMRKCENWFGFKPFIVAIDVAGRWGMGRVNAEQFSGIDNFMYIPSNPAQIEQFLTNFSDMDVFDAYTPLQSLHRSNRYDLVRENTL